MDTMHQLGAVFEIQLHKPGNAKIKERDIYINTVAIIITAEIT